MDLVGPCHPCHFLSLRTAVLQAARPRCQQKHSAAAALRQGSPGKEAPGRAQPRQQAPETRGPQAGAASAFPTTADPMQQSLGMAKEPEQLRANSALWWDEARLGCLTQR